MANPPTSIDSLSAPPPLPPENIPPQDVKKSDASNNAVKRWKTILILVTGIAYLFYVMWCLLLMSVLPSADGETGLAMIGAATCALAGLIFFITGLVTFFHISKSPASVRSRKFALIKLIVITVPGLVLSVVTPMLILRTAPLTIDIVSPAAGADLVAPITMTFSMEKSFARMQREGFVPLKYRWDINGDGTVDQETLDPSIIATFEREGIYTVRVVMQDAGNATKQASRKFIIRQAVFSVTPTTPVIDQPTAFSLAHLYPDPEVVEAVGWDFDGNGTIDEETEGVQSSYTYVTIGNVKVTAVVRLTNKTQIQYSRTISVEIPPELPFPVTVTSQPKNLIGTPPFSALFTVNTDEPLHSVQWTFGDGQKAEGERVTHTFTQKGSYGVTANVRSASGVVASVTTVVKVVDRLEIGDLKFEGTTKVQGNKISGEVPLTVDLKPITAVPFVTFTWEAPEATEIGSTEETLQAIFRRAGTYTITLVGQDTQDKVFRLPITVEVKPQASFIDIRMEPDTGVAPLTVKFDASETSIPGEDITGFIWNFGDSSPQEFGGAVTQHIYRTAGTYVVNVTVRTTSGKQQNTSKTLVVRAPLFQARILPSRLSGNAPLTVAFDGTASTGNIASYLWDFGDGSQNDGSKAEHTYTTPGTYTVDLTVTDTSGKTQSSSVTITVN